MLVRVLFVFIALLGLGGYAGWAQTEDSLSDDTIYQMKKGAERALQDYNAAMRELINPRISKSYRDRIVTEFTTPGNRQIFTESAYVVYDYDSDYLPPLETKERPIRTYLTDFNIFHQGTNSQQTMEVYYSLQKIHDIQQDEEGYYTIVDFESLYGATLPQPRRATLRLQPKGKRWEGLISYIKFNLTTEDDAELKEDVTIAPTVTPEQLLAERADSLLQQNDLSAAKALLDSSQAERITAYNTRLLGQYYQRQDSLARALEYYRRSLTLTETNETSGDNEMTRRLVENIQAELAERVSVEATGSELLSGAFQDVAEYYRMGKSYTIRWEANVREPLALMLYQNEELVQPLQKDLSGTSYTWRVPKELPKGENYQFQLQTPSSEAPIKSGVFRIKKKTPWGIYIGASVAVAAAAVYLLWPDGSGTETEEPLVDPPALPGN